MTSRNRAVDAGIAVLAFVLATATLRGGGFGDPAPDARALDLLGLSLAAASTLPLAARRAVPLTTFATVCGATLALYALGYPLDIPFGPAIGAYSIAHTYGGGRLPIRTAALAAVNLFVPLVAAAYSLAGIHISHIIAELMFWAVVFAGVWLAGDRARLRQAHLADLRERAERTQRTAERDRRLAVAEERTRIARELHDSAGHAINVILVQAGAARLLRQRDPERAQQAITTIEEVARETIGEIDRLVRALRDDQGTTPPVLTDPAALQELVDRHRHAGLSIDSHLHRPASPLPSSVSWAAYRILQEALTNAARHGKGQAQVTVAYPPRAVEITVTNPATVSGSIPGGTHGIIGMRERANLLGGRLEADVHSGVFRLHAWLPHNGRSRDAGHEDAAHQDAAHQDAGHEGVTDELAEKAPA